MLLAVMLFSKGEKWSVCRGAAVLPGLTDNQAITHVLRKFGSSSFPLSVVVMELACQLDEANLELDLRWVPRLQNEEADALTTSSSMVSLLKTGLRWTSTSCPSSFYGS